MIEAHIDVVNKLGLHARASAKLAQLSAGFTSDIRIGTDRDSLVDAKSIMSLMLLAAGIGSKLILCIEGSDEQQAAQQIKQLFADRFDEQE